ncbi:hypothetical protein LTR36_002305 [Oleoguttula mirabilis]|uniref:Uncharacterized protein n=1 Tax=Oleoguttula mirabilis TaxID=1507867 RepID=A0AAV9JLK8_9PEZI|nr:hypothetical protein LTR36_002305 [Oleoguttula mirabilis]
MAIPANVAVTENDILSLPDDPSFDPGRVLDLWEAAMHIVHDVEVATDNHKKEDAREGLVQMSMDVRRRLGARKTLEEAQLRSSIDCVPVPADETYESLLE